MTQSLLDLLSHLRDVGMETSMRIERGYVDEERLNRLFHELVAVSSDARKIWREKRR